MTAAWPSNISQNALQNGYSEQPQRNVVSFDTDAGITLERRRSSVSTDLLSFSMLLSLTEWSALLTFYRDTLNDGVLPFTMRHPRTNTETTFKFTEAPSMSGGLGSYCRVAMQIIRMP